MQILCNEYGQEALPEAIFYTSLKENNMTTMKNFVKNHALMIYFILALIISWGAIYLFAGPDGIPAQPDQAVLLGMAMLLGPATASLLLTGLISGREGYRKLLSRLLRWRVSTRWYVVALLTAPLSTAAVLLVLSFFSPAFVPTLYTSGDVIALILTGIVAGLMVGFFEELGWTGFAIPQMRHRFSILATGLIVGLLWGAWHFLLFWENDSFAAALPLALLLARLFSWLPAYRILMVRVFDNTESLLVVILMHMSLVATLTIIDPVLTGAELLVFILVRAIVLWIIVSAVTVAGRRLLNKSGYVATK